MNPFRKYLELLKVNHYIKLLTASAFIAIGAIFGTDGIAEIESMRWFFDAIMFLGMGLMGLYVLILTVIGIYNVSGGGYQVGSYNKWRDGDFEEWKKKNNVGNNKFDKFIDWFDNPFKK